MIHSQVSSTGEIYGMALIRLNDSIFATHLRYSVCSSSETPIKLTYPELINPWSLNRCTMSLCVTWIYQAPLHCQQLNAVKPWMKLCWSPVSIPLVPPRKTLRILCIHACVSELNSISSEVQDLYLYWLLDKELIVTIVKTALYGKSI